MNAKLDKAVTMQRAQALTRLQYGALCYRFDGDTPLVLLITSRGTGRWILPKGWPIPGLDGAATAAREAWEEAGVVGRVSPVPLGAYHYVKLLDKRREVPCKVEVYPLCVARLEDEYPETGQRQRVWFAATEAARKVDEPELKQLLGTLDPMALRRLCPTATGPHST